MRLTALIYSLAALLALCASGCPESADTHGFSAAEKERLQDMILTCGDVKQRCIDVPAQVFTFLQE